MNVRVKKRPIAALGAAVILAAALTTDCGAKADAKQAARFKAEDVNVQQVHAYNEFAARMTKQLLLESGEANMVVSPLSVTLALSLALNGAGGATEREMLQMLGADNLSMEVLNQGSEVLTDLLEHGDPKVDVQIANALWARKGTQLLDDYSSRLQQFYDAKVSELDFDDKAAAGTINKWVRKQTHDRIDNMVDSASLSSNVMVLMNAIYFNGSWTEPFEESATRDAQFHLADGTNVTVPMMRQRTALTYKVSDSFKAIRLPYGNQSWGMIVVLPNKGVSLRDAEAEMLADPAQSWRQDYEGGDAVVELPKFKLEYSKSLVAAMKALGMKQAFDAKQADFSGMTHLSKGFYVSNILHKAFIEVNERGTEAAAVTAVMMAGSAAPVKEPFEFRADRPFFFAIEDRTTGALVFMGSVSNPAAE
ncbi:serpin family protein [Paenibacillus solisilvae]|uniref:Serpin family protein n=1 Tax=Paenibacillus solisilvae TaxID=2486751 RepID=A0ABW0VUU8_9BACL